mgnify:CR=1 FL=1
MEENTKRATAFAKYAYDKGIIPLTAHLLFPFMDDTNEEDRRTAIFIDIVLMDKCQEVWLFGNKITRGVRIEIEKAKKRRQKVRYFGSEFQKVEDI